MKLEAILPLWGMVVHAVAAGATVLGFFGATKLVESIEKRSKKNDEKPEEIPAGAKS